MRKYILLVFSLLSLSCMAQNTRMDRFTELLDSKDTTGLRSMLAQWQKEKPKDGDLYAAYANFYLRLAMQKAINMDKSVADGLHNPASIKKDSLSSIMLTDKKNDFEGEQKEIAFDSLYMDSCVFAYERGIKLHPERLDLRYGLASALTFTKNWDKMVKTLCNIVTYSAENGNQWKWLNNETYTADDNSTVKEEVNLSVLGYITEIDCKGREKYASYLNKLSDTQLKYNPNYIPAISNKGMAIHMQGDDKGALAMFKRAEKIDPKDEMVLQNIAYLNQLLGKKKEAIAYYKKLIKLNEGNDEKVQLYQDCIDNLKSDN